MLGNATRLLDLVQGLAIGDLLGSPATIEFELPLLHVVVVEKRCAYCGRVAHRRCGRCRMLRYCSAECQRVAWPQHRQMCEKLVSHPFDNSGSAQRPEIEVAAEQDL